MNHSWRDDESPRELLRKIVRQNRMIVEALRYLGAKVTDMETKMAIDFAALEAEVARNTAVDESASALLDGLTEEIRKLGQGMDPAAQAKINDFAANLAARNDALAAAVEKNTLPTPT